VDLSSQRGRLLLLAAIGIAPFLINGVVNSLIYQNAWWYWGFEMLTWIVIPGLVFYQVSKTPGLRLADLGYHGAIRGHRNLALLLLACAVFAPMCYLVYARGFAFFERLFPAQSLFEYGSVVPDAGISHVLVVLYLGLSAGLVEEFLFRGLLYRAVAECRHASTLFLLISPLLFSLIHWEDGVANLLATYVVGLFLAAAYLGLQNLWPLVIGHVFTDLVWFG
jgi:membrane protease YdiL (CAAX protease family)